MFKKSKNLSFDDKLFKYYVYYPSVVKENMPVLFYLHGIGERGENLEDILNDYPKLTEAEKDKIREKINK